MKQFNISVIGLILIIVFTLFSGFRIEVDANEKVVRELAGVWTISDQILRIEVNGLPLEGFLTTSLGYSKDDANASRILLSDLFNDELTNYTLKLFENGAFHTQFNSSETTGSWKLTEQGDQMILESGEQLTHFTIDQYNDYFLVLQLRNDKHLDLDQDGRMENLSLITSLSFIRN